MESVNNYYKKWNLKDKLTFAKTISGKVFKILRKSDKTNPSGIDDLSGIFPKDGAKLLTMPITHYAIYQCPQEYFLTPAK